MKKKTATYLTAESVSILTQQFDKDENGEEVQVGSNHRCSYSNSESGRALLAAKEPEDIVAEVLTVWGDEPTVAELDMSEFTPEPTTEERIAQLEETVALQTENEAELLYQVSLMQLGITENEM